jgi:hypothetical protein
MEKGSKIPLAFFGAKWGSSIYFTTKNWVMSTYLLQLNINKYVANPRQVDIIYV